MTNANKLDLIYVFDPMCGWCYGFNPVVTEICARFEGRLNVEVLSGGMAAGDKAMPVEAVRDYIENASAYVTERTGVKFGQAFYQNILQRDGEVLDSEPPSIALAVFREMSDQILQFSHKMQEALFLFGKSLNEYRTYSDILQSFEINIDDLMVKMRLDKYKEKTYSDFKICHNLGVSAYPTLIAKRKDGNLTVLTRGYQSFEALKPALEQLLN